MKYIDTARFCHDNTKLSGSLMALDLPRLAAEVLPHSDFVVDWTAEGVSPDFMDLSLKSTVQMTCQRCLTALPEQIDVSYRFKFALDEATAQAEDEQTDDVDMLVHARQFDLLELIEDEMLMALPFVSLHETCPDAGALAFLPKEEKQNPFAILKTMA